MGVACGLGYYIFAGTTMVLALVVLSLFGLLEKRVLEPRMERGNGEGGNERSPNDVKT